MIKITLKRNNKTFKVKKVDRLLTINHQGRRGLQGEQGDQGIQGEQGIQGVQGNTGATGPIGQQGIKGDKGDQGQKGDIGLTGPQGAKGNTGNTGPIGPQGIQGNTGPQGNTGQKGDQGIPGTKGDKGDKGDTGLTGSTGPMGTTGATGPAGADADWSDVENATGKTTPIDADLFALLDSAASFVLKKLTFTNLKATLKSYFDSVYQAALGFTAENVANKDTDTALAANSDTKYPSQKAIKTYTDAKVADAINDSVTTIAPSENAVFDALALKIPTSYLDTDVSLATNSDAKVATQKATKAYIDAVAQGLSVKGSVKLGTAAALPTNTYLLGVITITATGVLTIDGVAVALNDRILVKDEAATLKNGVYVCTTAGAIGVAAVLTRSNDMDSAAEFPGAFVFVEAGTANTGAGFVCTNSSNPTIGSTGINFTQFSGAGEITAGTGIGKSGNTLSIDTSVTVDKTTAQTLTNKTLTSPAITTPTGIVKGDISLGNVDNTSDATKNAASAILTTKQYQFAEAPSNQVAEGLTISLTYGESIVPGDLLYFKSDGKVYKADSDGSSTYPVMGLALETASSGSHLVLLSGIYRDDSRYNFTVGGLVYISTTAGGETQTQPSGADNVIQVVGIALHADRIYFAPSRDYITHT